MAESTVADRKKVILQELRNKSVDTIVLVGESGVGKTWIAREVSIQAIKENLFKITLWVFLNREYNEDTLRESIARQLGILPTIEEWEPEDGKGEAEKKEENQKSLEGKISEKLQKICPKKEKPEEQEKLLLILDDVGNKMKEEDIMPKLETLLNVIEPSSYKIIITRKESIQSHKTRDEVETGPKPLSVGVDKRIQKVVEVKPLSIRESMSLLRTRTGTNVHEYLAKSCVEKTKGLPAAIITMAKALTYFGNQYFGLSKFQSALEEASANGGSYDLSQLVRGGYDSFPHSVLIDILGSGGHFFSDRGSVHYNELITYWILEGFIGTCTDGIEEAYAEGHRVLMELMDFQMLKNVEAGYVIMDGSPLNFDESQLYRGLHPTASLGLASVFDDNWEGLGRVTPVDGMVKTLFCAEEEQKLSTLLLDGNRLSREVPEIFFESMQELQVLSIFNPNFNFIPELFSKMNKLRVLVLRGCKFLHNLDHFPAPEALTVLEISGPSSLKTIPEELFWRMPQLRTLNLSTLQIDLLPDSLYKLKELCWLILRGCSCLVMLKSLANLTKLMVLDLSGATSLTTIQDKSFKQNPTLQTLNFSQTKITYLPKLVNLTKLTFLSLRDCRFLGRLPGIQTLTGLQTLDLSGAEKFKEFHEKSLTENGLLKILDLSETAVKSLPSNISNPRHLFLRRSKLVELTSIESLRDLEELDLSGTSSLQEIDNNFFENLKFLQILNLSETKIRSLPSISNLSNLRQLNLSGCCDLKAIHNQSFDHMSRLQNLDLSGTMIESVPSLSKLSNLRCLVLEKCNLKVAPQLESLSNLEELNLCGMRSLKDTGADFLKSMSNLKILNLSETMLEELPSMSSLKNLKQLFLRGCLGLKTVPDLLMLKDLEVLDLSGTAVTSLPSLDNITQLRRLLLRDCFNLEDFVNLHIGDVLGTTSTELPEKISILAHLEHLDPQNMKYIERDDCEEKDLYRWGISSLPTDIPWDNDRPCTPISSTTFFQLLKRIPSFLTNLANFYFCIHPIEGQNSKRGRVFDQNELIFKDIHFFKTTEFSHFKDQRSLDIRGFHDPPKGIEDILSHADCVFLVNNTFKRWLSDLGASNLKVMKGCWIEECTNMESLFHEEEAEDILKLQTTLETFGVSNAINLKSLYSGNKRIEVFRNLKSLFLDCCPNLSTLFSSLPPESLKVLQIKFCDNLKTLFDESLPDEHRLPNLQTLHLWGLPELKCIGCPLPSLQALKVCECPNLHQLEEDIKSAKSLQVLWVSNVIDLKCIYSGDLQPESLNSLKSLTLENCPKLVNVISSPQPPMNLETLQIKCCGRLETVFEHGRSADYTLSSLHTLHLQELPKLERVGARMVSPRDHVPIECPKCRDYPMAGMALPSSGFSPIPDLQ